MSQNVPTISEVSANIYNQLVTNVTGASALLPKAFIRVLSKVLGAVFVILYKYGSFIFLQLFVSTASFKQTEIGGKLITPLIEWGRQIGVGDPAKAIRAEFDTSLEVLTQGGALPSGTQFLSDDNSVIYISTEAVPLTSASVTVHVKASSDPSDGGGAGVIGNLDVGKTVSLVTPKGDTAAFVTITSQTVTGADAETEENYRARVSDRFKKRLEGGAYTDYEYWGELAADILNVYPYTGPPGRVSVYSESATEPDGIPTQAQLDAVKSSKLTLDKSGFATRSPVNAHVDSYPITRLGFTVSVSVFVIDGDEIAVKETIKTLIEQYFLDREPYIIGLSVAPKKDSITAGAISGIMNSIAAANGGWVSGVIVKLGGVPGVYSLGEGQKCKLEGPITWP